MEVGLCVNKTLSFMLIENYGCFFVRQFLLSVNILAFDNVLMEIFSYLVYIFYSL